jgi:hypothetical protein
MVVCFCNPSYLEDRDKTIVVLGLPGQKHKTNLKNVLKAKGLDVWLKWERERERKERKRKEKKERKKKGIPESEC